ncbi:MAG: alpha/beta hydrolase [Pseudomonadota bacterium]
MIDDPRGAIDYDEHGSGPATLVFVPGSFATGAAWRAVFGALQGRYRLVTTSLLGYGGTAERRGLQNLSIDNEVEVLDAVLKRVGGPVHLVGHSFGAWVALAWAMRNPPDPLSLTVIEPPAPGVLEAAGEHTLVTQFRTMSDAYIAAWRGGEAEAARRVIDFYGGTGFFDSMPPRVREFTIRATGANVYDWLTAYDDRCDAAAFSRIAAPTQVLRGGLGHPAVQRSNELISQWLPKATLVTVPGASHFMITTHAAEVARLVEAHVDAVTRSGIA